MDEKERNELQKKLEELQAELKQHYVTAEAQQQKHGTILEDHVAKMTKLQTQLDAIDMQLTTKIPQAIVKTNQIEEQMKDSASLDRLLKERRGTAVINFKDGAADRLINGRKQITEVGLGFQTTGVMPIERIPGIVPEARQVLSVRNILASRPTTMAVVDFVRVTTPMTIASPVPEASTKPQNQLILTAFSEKIRTLATWIPASKQILDDMGELMGFIEQSLPYYVNLEEELQLLSGDSTGENLHGLIPQAALFNVSMPGGSTRIDAIGAAIGQITAAKELPPTFAIVNTSDWWGMRLLKDNYGRYLLGDPQSVVSPTLFGLDIVYTTSIAKGTFLVGSGSPIAAEIRDRMEMQVEVSTEHMDYFIKNLVAIRAEKRLALLVKRPNSYVTGSFTGLSLAEFKNGPVSPPTGSPVMIAMGEMPDQKEVEKQHQALTENQQSKPHEGKHNNK